ncbi:hypothetical protein PAXRUDRAFT_137789, partial [Paxillus rubicundulus Ve08.2h10]
ITKDWDIIALQEPHISPMKNTTSSKCYHVVYPSTCYTSPESKLRATTLISTSINTNSWMQLPFPSPDVVIIQLVGTFGCCTLFNIYNDGTSQ